MKQSSDFIMPEFYDLRNGKYLFCYNRETITEDNNSINKFNCIEVDRCDKENALNKIIEMNEDKYLFDVK